MAGTVEGGRKAAKTNKVLYGDGFYARIGAKGGRNGHTGGFAANPELARKAGAKGGKASKRGLSSQSSRYERTMLLMHTEGFSMADIARELDLPYYVVSYYFRKRRKA